MVINAGTANKGGKSYGLYEDGVDVTAGTTNVLSYTIWMAELDMAHATTIPSPTSSEVVVKTPALPGLELHIPANPVITADDGTPVTEISITPIRQSRHHFHFSWRNGSLCILRFSPVQLILKYRIRRLT